MQTAEFHLYNHTEDFYSQLFTQLQMKFSSKHKEICSWISNSIKVTKIEWWKRIFVNIKMYVLGREDIQLLK